jgi:hypothetical protein
MQYLLDVYVFAQEDLDINSDVLTWPKRINPIFDQNDEVSLLFLLLPLIMIEIHLGWRLLSVTP